MRTWIQTALIVAAIMVTLSIHWRLPVDPPVTEPVQLEMLTVEDPPCIREEIPCGGGTVLIVTCCKAGETPAECVARHQAKVREWNDACGN